jgi:hypothetical protein
MGLDDEEPRSSFVGPLSTLEGVVISNLVCGSKHSLILSRSGKLFSGGCNQFGQVGPNGMADQTGGRSFTCGGLALSPVGPRRRRQPPAAEARASAVSRMPSPPGEGAQGGVVWWTEWHAIDGSRNLSLTRSVGILVAP